MSNSSTVTPDSNGFDFATRIGMLFIVQSAAMSALAVSGLLLYIAYSTITIQPNATRRWSTETHIHYYFLNLMVCDLIQAIGGLLNIKWIAEARVYPSPICTVQGLLKQVGDVGLALSTMVIALHTLQVLVFGWNSPPKFALVVLGVTWSVIALLVVIPSTSQAHYYDPTGTWCWIKEGTNEQIGLDYLWMWLAMFLDIVVYVFLALILKRVVIIDGRKLRRPRGEERRQPIFTFGESTGPHGGEGTIALRMLFYPAVYIITVLPISVARFSEFNHHDVPFVITAVADTLFVSSGLLNTVLYAYTRPKLMPHRHRDNQIMILSPVTPAARFSRAYDTQGRLWPYHPSEPKERYSPANFDWRTVHGPSDLQFAYPA